MQKLVEVTHYNMSRIRIVWSRIWAILGEHFQRVALRHEQQVRVPDMPCMIYDPYMPYMSRRAAGPRPRPRQFALYESSPHADVYVGQRARHRRHAASHVHTSTRPRA